MAENITQYKAGQALLVLLQQQELKPQVVQQITDVVAELLQEAGRAQESSKTTKGNQQLQQQQQTQPQQQQAPSIRDLKNADAVLQGVSLIVPRGKFDCGFYSDCLQVTNKQTTADIPYSSIQHVLIIDAVPKQPSTTFLVLVMKSGQPVRQGKNALDLVVVQTKDQPEVTLPSPAACAHLGPQLVGAAAVVISQLLASYIGDIEEDTFLTVDSRVFSSSAGDLMIAANKGAQAGWLVPLSAGLCYLGKQGSFMPKGSISKVAFHRTGAGSSTFDITIKLTAAAAAGKDLELGQIDAAELAKLQTYCLNQRIKMGAGDDESDDEEAAAANPAAKAGVCGAGAAAAAGADAGDSDSDEDDEDFDPEAAGRKGAKRRWLDGAGTSSAAAAAAGAADSDDDDDDDEEELEDEASDLSSDPDLVATDEMSDMEDDGLGDYE